MAKRKSVTNEENSSKISNITEITIDSSVDDVIKYDKEGVLLQFSSESFLELSDEVVQDLHKDNKLNYTLARRAHINRLKAADDGMIGRSPIRLSVAGGIALAKINGGGAKNVNENEWHRCWKRPDEESEAKSLGYVPTGETINYDGKTELIEFVVPKEDYEEHLKAVGEESRSRTNRVIESAVTTIEGLTGEKAINTSGREVTGVPKQ